ncbi:hypothetical protein [Pacificoceanicola onchidii]|uniref:hypothetical protein n=1 Tax=Pacificoceanicola onchidii TaxID=2562685 RepID=UPI0010A412C8|nr:hypothetical protein [Pacificoceanicola onchidii]
MTGTGVHSALARAGAYGVDGVPKMLVQGADIALAYVHAQIGGIVLPRILTVRLDGKTILSCSVSGRRLLSVEAGGKHCAIAGTEDKAAALDMLRQAVTQACSTPGVLTADTCPLRPAPPAGQAGISADEIARSLALARSDAGTDRLTAFVDSAGDAIHAAACLREDMLFPLKGSEDAMDRLADVVDALLEDLDSLHASFAPSQNTPSLLMFERPPKDFGLCAAFDGAQILLAETQPRSEAHLAHAWGELTG